MRHILIVLLCTFGLPQLILSDGDGCPQPAQIGPRTDDDKSMCAIMYEHAEPDINTSCFGATLQASNGERSNWNEAWNDRISSMVVREGCTLSGYEHGDFDGNKKDFTGVHEYLPNENEMKHEWNWNDKISSYVCKCIFEPVDCNPVDKWQKIASCGNTLNDDNITCKYSYSHGIDISKMITNGGDISNTISKSIGVEIEGIFASSSASLTTGYNWSESDEFSQTMTEAIEVEFPVPPGASRGVYQVQGECGDSSTKTMCIEVRDMDTKMVVETTC